MTGKNSLVVPQNDPAIAAQIALLLPAIYAAATNPSRWLDAFAPIVQLLGGHKGLVFSHQATPNQQGIWVHYQISNEDFRPYVEHYHAYDIWMQRAHENGIFVQGRVFTGDDLLPRKEFLDSVFYREFLALHDIYDVCGGTLHDGSEAGIPRVHVAVYRPETTPTFSTQEKVLLAALIPHLRESIRISFQLGSLERRASIMQTAVETISPALMLLDAQGKVVFTNRRAQAFLTANDNLKIMADTLVVEGRQQQARLDALLKISPAQETLLGIPHSSGKHNLWLIRVPMLPGGDAPPDARRPTIALMLHDSEATNTIDMKGFAKVHNLTPSESRVLSLLLEHVSLPPIALALGITMHTVRSQLRTIREKTGAKRQAELVRMLMSWPRRIE
jgi:DNA-binding CsgD family transcriptional regulator/PAS domain-containing protein